MGNLYKTIFFIFTYFSVSHAQIQFSEQSAALGCGNSTYGVGTLGGGISFFDFDNDGWDDISVTSEEGLPLRFFKNTGGAFTQVTFNFPDQLAESKTVQWVDFDNDGDYDLFTVSNTHAYRLYENDGTMNFTDISPTAGLAIPDYSAWGGSWGDYNNDGWLDLFISSRDINNTDIHNRLYRNNGDATFTDITEAAGISTDDFLTFCSVFFDYNNDGWQDIYLANDRSFNLNILYENNGDGTFSDVSAASGADIGISAMSNTIGDFNKDGWLDIYITNLPDGNVFLKNNGDGTFTDIAETNGTLMESYAWGAVFLDAENDSDLDLYVSSLFTDAQTQYLTAAFYENNGSGMYSIPENAGFENDAARSYSNAIGDVNRDGYPDITVLNFQPDDIYLWKNETPHTNNWIKVKLRGTESNRQGIGSWIEISVNGEKQYNYTLCGEGYIGQNSVYEFFGIGTATTIDYIKVTWLSGIVDIINNPDINIHATIIEGTNELATEDFQKQENSIIIYPNPVNGIVSIQLKEELSNSTLSVTDMLGRLLFTKKVSSISETINMEQYGSGMYFFVFDNGLAKITKKIIVK
ncbi:putative secreted protein (Por secretion system target) [Ulvibacter sp. MAR_2010_11]|uniref:FG-GAP-like repeat-containing protein n=1 Tax=Ulvibacter sp. MAR_2010_11 TaxID=1250229 RepID=UPI000C2C1CD0|nr:FG-GAP-like repeat-containing protein [Ulvibacter sp. MAR_2010_11]PKA84593.1 putative secreted protein (Por secretion system target) [Ulvibacter sp. MAR_2010_11]